MSQLQRIIKLVLIIFSAILLSNVWIVPLDEYRYDFREYAEEIETGLRYLQYATELSGNETDFDSIEKFIDCFIDGELTGNELFTVSWEFIGILILNPNVEELWSILGGSQTEILIIVCLAFFYIITYIGVWISLFFLVWSILKGNQEIHDEFFYVLQSFLFMIIFFLSFVIDLSLQDLVIRPTGYALLAAICAMTVDDYDKIPVLRELWVKCSPKKAIKKTVKENIQEDKQEIWICLNCKKENSVTAYYCAACGEKKTESKLCSSCGQPLDDDAIFCEYCGKKV